MNEDTKLIRLRDAAKVLGISYSTLKRWIHTRKLRTVKTHGGHHRIPERELDKHLHFAERRCRFHSVALSSGKSAPATS